MYIFPITLFWCFVNISKMYLDVGNEPFLWLTCVAFSVANDFCWSCRTRNKVLATEVAGCQHVNDIQGIRRGLWYTCISGGSGALPQEMFAKNRMKMVRFGAVFLPKVKLIQLPSQFSSCQKYFDSCQTNLAVARFGRLATDFATLITQTVSLSQMYTKETHRMTASNNY